MNGTRIDFEMYSWEPEPDEHSAAAYFVSTAPPPPATPAPTSQGMTIVPAARDGVLSRPVGDVLNSVVGDTVLSRPVGEVLSSARRSFGRRRDTTHGGSTR